MSKKKIFLIALIIYLAPALVFWSSAVVKIPLQGSNGVEQYNPIAYVTIGLMLGFGYPVIIAAYHMWSALLSIFGYFFVAGFLDILLNNYWKKRKRTQVET